MKSKRLFECIKANDLIIPSILLMNYKKFEMNEKELLFMALLMTSDDLIAFDPVYFKNKIGFDANETIEIMSNLTSKKYIDVVIKKENNKMKEYLTAEPFYEKVMFDLIDEEDADSSTESKIYEVIETEFGRTLSPIEFETISGWLNAKIDESLIKEALKEAVLNGVNNLKYIDKILYEWTKKGYKVPSDIKKRKNKEPEEIDLFEYDWLDEND